MLDLLQPLARPKLFALNELSHGVKRGGGEMATLRLVGKFLGSELADEIRESLGHVDGMRVSISRVFPFRTPKSFIGHPVLRKLAPHVRHVRREMDVPTVFAAINIRASAAIVFATRPPLQTIFSSVARHRTAVGEGQCFLKRNVDALARSSAPSVTNTREAQHGRNRCRDLVG